MVTHSHGQGGDGESASRPRALVVAGTLHAVVAAQAARAPDAIALEAPHRAPLSYGGLLEQIERCALTLAAMGVQRGARVALVLPGGPDVASAFLGVAAMTTCAPLNPAYVAAELEAYLATLAIEAIIVQRGSESPARKVAAARRIRVVELSPSTRAGTFTLVEARSDAPPARPIEPSWASAGDPALLLHTSGTTTRPKVVPLTHANLIAAARAITAALELSPSDRCLDPMPLFHIHGLSAVLSSLVAGARVICPRAFDPVDFPGWARVFEPTWMTAAPAIHRAVLEAARRHPEIAARRSFRLFRSASAPMPEPMIAEMESMFGVPFIEAYGMTEAAPQIASNPVPPGERRRGSVGRAAGPEIAILGEDGRLLPAGQPGEVAIRGASVMRAYEGDPEANREAFVESWLRTGDLGRLDHDGYLFITGRIKEIINRGGEKIAPREVDDALLAHPAVAEAATFSVPHPRLGEDVAAAVVLHPGASATARELQDLVARRLADFKVPRRVVFVSALPRGATGKVQRIGLAERLGLAGGASRADGGPPRAPRGAVEEAIARIWREVLGVAEIGARDDFFELGGHSLYATQVLTRVRAELGVELSMATLFAEATVEALGRAVAAAQERASAVEVARMIEGLEQMSEEEAQRLLQGQARVTGAP